MNGLYNIKEETAFDRMVAILKEMSEQEQQHFVLVLQGYRAGIKAGQNIAGKYEKETA